MNKAQALEAFDMLVGFQNDVTGDAETPGWIEPQFDVRLDAGSEDSRDGETYGQTVRTWRIRVTFSKSGWTHDEKETLHSVLDIAGKFDASVSIQNNGLELT